MTNLTYQDCLELKDAGFPQGSLELPLSLYMKPSGRIFQCGPLPIPADFVQFEDVKIPTLEELIDAMPMRKKYHPDLINDAHFFLMKRVGAVPDYRAYYEGESGEGIIKDWSCLGDSPSQAVKELYLALNKKV